MRNILITTNKNFSKYSLRLTESILITNKERNYKIFIHIEEFYDKELKNKFHNLFKEYEYINYELIFIEPEISKELLKEIPEKYRVIYRRLFASEIINDSFLYLDADGIVLDDLEPCFKYYEKHATKSFFIPGQMDSVLDKIDSREIELFRFFERLFKFYKGDYPIPPTNKLFEIYGKYLFTAVVYYSGKKVPKDYFYELCKTYKYYGNELINEFGSWDELLLNLTLYHNEKFRDDLFDTVGFGFDPTLSFTYSHFGPFKDQLNCPINSWDSLVDDFEFPRVGFYSQQTYLKIIYMLKHKKTFTNIKKEKLINETRPFCFSLWEKVKENKDILKKEYEVLKKEHENLLEVYNEYNSRL